MDLRVGVSNVSVCCHVYGCLDAYLLSSADPFRILLDSHYVRWVKSVAGLGVVSDAQGSVGAVTHNGKRYKQACLVTAFRGVGLEVPYTCDGPFWVKHAGDEMLAPYGLEVKAWRG